MENDENKQPGAVSQSIKARVYRNVVAGDLEEGNTQSNTGDGVLQVLGDNNTVMQIGKLLNSLTESTLQANFYAATGIRCGPKVRATMEYLMEKHDFNGYELGRAWNTHSLVKEGNAGNLKGSAIFLSLVMGWLGVIGTTAYGVMFGAALLFSIETMAGLKLAVLAGLLLIGYLGGLHLFIHTFLKPTYIARRVIKVLQSSPPPFFAAVQSGS